MRGGSSSPGRPVRSLFGLAVRLTRAAALGWIVGIGAYAFLLGLLVKDMLEFFRESPGFTELVERFGLGTLDTPERFLGLPFSIIVVFVSVAAVQQVGAIREEETSGRLETLLTQPLERRRWLGGRLAVAVLALLALVVVVGIATATGVVLRGEGIDLARLALACLNLLPISLLFVGLGLAIFGLRPRLTAPVLYRIVVGGFLLEFIGAVLELPEAILSISPFHHVEPAPAVDPAVGASLVMLACAAVGALVGFAAFRRRDLEGA